MSHLRIQLDVAIPEPIPSELADVLPRIQENLILLKSYASKIDEGLSTEKNTKKTAYHACRHDEGLSCDAWEEMEE